MFWQGLTQINQLSLLPNSVPAQAPAWLSWLYFQLIQPPDTHHLTPDTRTSINLASYNSKLKGKVVYIDIMNSKASLNSNFINQTDPYLASFEEYLDFC